MHKDDLVLVTGASGFIASWVVYYALQTGARVRGTVRDPNNLEKVKHLKALPGAEERLELVALDLLNESQFAKVVEGVTLIAHTASPFPSAAPKDEEELIRPAVDGTVGILRAALNVKTVRSVVVTSSVAAVGEGSSIAGEPKRVRGEDDWTDVTKTYPYAKSKTLAEKAAWDFWNENGRPWALSTINPSFVQGPMLNSDVTTSSVMCVRILKGEIPAAPRACFGIVDVRDVARAHVTALSLPPDNVSGRRFILNNQSKWIVELAKTIGITFGPMGYPFSRFEAPNFALWLYSWFDESVGLLYPSLGIYVEFDNTPSKDILKIEYTELVKTMADTGHSLVYHGHVPKLPKYQLPSPDWAPLTS